MDIKEFVQQRRDVFIAMRRDFHMYPEPAWLEYRSASKVADKLISLGYDVALGSEVLDLNSRMGLPSDEVMKAAMERAIDEGADPELVEKMGYGKTSSVATLKFSDDGPVVAFRADIVSNDVIESKASNHIPAKDGFQSRHEKAMHACGHDTHMTMGLGLAEYIATHKDGLKGTIKLIFQPAEEGVRGAKAMAEAGVVDDVDLMFGMHIGFNEQLSNCFACSDHGFLATTKLDAVFHGYSAHAGGSPEKAQNAMLAGCTAVLNLQAIARHSAGASRMNVGVFESGTGRNVTPDVATLKLETRGATTEINDYMIERTKTIIKGAAEMHDCTFEITKQGETPAGRISDDLAREVQSIIEPLGIFKEVPFDYSGGGSEDCAYFLNRVIDRGGRATYMVLGSAIKAPHHNPLFDIDEEDMLNGIVALGTIATHYLK
ncbi:MAG: amidohydrolase [Veillonella sp.]|nr:amidohydrolase [Veillonella sp.]